MNNSDTAQQHRILVSKAKRIVVKVGTNVLVDKNGRPNKRRMQRFVEELANFHANGYEIVLVSSGAIGSGMQALGMKQRPRRLPDLQMAAAVGQTCLLTIYNEFFSKHKIQISQVLLTHDDLRSRTRHLNARNTMMNLLRHGVIPIVNENDVVAVDEIKVGDNDVLSALVTVLIDADLLIMLTTPNGLRKPSNGNRSQRVAYLSDIHHDTFDFTLGKTNELSTGGMETKLKAAEIAAKVGALVVIASGFAKDIISKVLSGNDVGTLIGNRQTTLKRTKRKHWIAVFHRTQGQVVIDDGAKHALSKNGKSLLAIGITKVIGDFSVGALVDVLDLKGNSIAKGLVDYSSKDLDRIKRQDSRNISKILGRIDYDAVIHRDNMVVGE